MQCIVYSTSKVNAFTCIQDNKTTAEIWILRIRAGNHWTIYKKTVQEKTKGSSKSAVLVPLRHKTGPPVISSRGEIQFRAPGDKCTVDLCASLVVNEPILIQYAIPDT